MTTLHESPCGQPFSTAEDAASHQWHCDQCAGVLERLEAELDAMDASPSKVIEVGSLVTGDSFEYAGTGVTVLRDPEPCSDSFGRDMLKLWGMRHDTDAEGWIMFGPLAMVEVMHSQPALPGLG